MGSRLLDPHDHHALSRHLSHESCDSFELDDADFEAYGFTSEAYLHKTPSPVVERIVSAVPFLRRRYGPGRARAAWSLSRKTYRKRTLSRLLCHSLAYATICVFALVIITTLFFPSYSRPPSHYQTLRQTVFSMNERGRGNARNEKIFIAASIYDKDGSLAGGQWGENVLELIELLGPRNVYLSVYENDTGDESAVALKALEDKVLCNKSMVYEEHLDPKVIRNVTLPDGTQRVKRIAYLAEVRNRALKPLYKSDVQFDKLLYLNDVYFNPIDVLQLLFSTNVDEFGVAQYRAACSVDFINPFKFYDTFATRDLEGYGMGLPLYPFFSTAGNGESRRDVQDQKDAVRVRSCWGGMVAFDARFFQPSLSHNNSSLSTDRAIFRAEPDAYWDASECCLIHADIQIPPHEWDDEYTTTGIYMNPYVRVAYDSTTLTWLSLTRRFERLYSIPQNIINHLVGLPWFNPRRTETAGEMIQDEVWVPDSSKSGGGSYKSVTRKAGTGGFCGRYGLQVMKTDPEPGDKPWEILPVPLPPP